MSIAGPNMQMPAGLSKVFTTDEKGTITGLQQEWAQFFHAIQGTLWAGTRSGTSSDRLTSTIGSRYIGMCFFDTTLGIPVFLKTASSNVWVRYDGTPV